MVTLYNNKRESVQFSCYYCMSILLTTKILFPSFWDFLNVACLLCFLKFDLRSWKFCPRHNFLKLFNKKQNWLENFVWRTRMFFAWFKSSKFSGLTSLLYIKIIYVNKLGAKTRWVRPVHSRDRAWILHTNTGPTYLR